MKQGTIKIINELNSRYPALESYNGMVREAIQVTIDSFSIGGKLLVCGNGGSAADSLHIVGELMKAFVLPRKIPLDMCNKIRSKSPESADYLISNLQLALPAISLVSEIGLSTAYSNDMAPDLCFAQQVFGYGKEGDVLLGISTSGNSANVIYAAQMAKVQGMKVIILTGKTGGKLIKWADVLITVPETDTYKIQEYHLPIYHAYCQALENEFFGD